MKIQPLLLALALCTAPALAGTHVETFSTPANPDGWTWGNGFDSIQPAGGNPGGYLANPNTDTFAPQLRCAPGAPNSTGNYRALGVTDLYVDLRVFSTQFPYARELSVILTDDNGTPGDPSDDASVYRMTGQQVPQVAEGWKSFLISVPSAHAHLPAGWQVLNGAGTADAVWNQVITNVREVRYFFGDPTFFFIFDLWSVGADNLATVTPQISYICAALTTSVPCPCANDGVGLQGCANSTGAGAVLDLAGSTSVAANDLSFSAHNLPPSSSVLLFQGTSAIGPNAFGDGQRCAGGTVRRLGIRTASATGSASWGPGLATLGAWAPMTTRHFQAWYRNVIGPCGSGFNLSSGRSVTFTP